MERIEAVLFDWGGVLIDNPAPGLMDHCARALGVSVEDYSRVHERYCEAFQKGSIQEAEFWRSVCGDLERPVPSVASLWGQAFRSAYSPRDEIFGVARQVHDRGYKTAVLSNTEAVATAFARQSRYRVFDAIVLSCAEGVMKPERQIYEAAAARLRTPLERCVLIDDRPPFIAGAVAAGMKGIVYENPAQVVKDLTELGVNVNGELDPG